ncbi:uncharacterized protein LOC117174251 isoform X2 [Belonocnema kinseyi]|uniref:uncharacterized protein LOC117174251 isoform X2 n=1 Tax=Belonocnema kinseyi TaxID=2817044 RepID=UPI00143D0661|nr:uncharacterized protein LOC117174251 isoform X2 [Belonocnema kinseyi]
MDVTDEINFGDLQKHERYKKLQRDLKLARIKQTKILENSEFNVREKFKTNFNLKTSGLIQSLPWPSCSSINADPSDFNSTVTSSTLQVSRTGSEVLASSCHLKKLISKRQMLHKPMATSSLKQYSEADQSVDDRAIMPPPSSSNIIRPPAKRSSPSVTTESLNQSRQPPSFTDDLYSRGKQSFSDGNSSTDHPEDSGCPQDQSRGKPIVRDFYRWRVVLNDQGQLLIKGSLENGKIARSKPVLKMLSSTKVESIYKHTYCLHGNIIDEKNELPKYIYTKFYSGFPDDWENIHQIWKNYVAQGSKENYRWPMDVCFSDDDLNSEITDITDIHRSSETKFQEPSSIDKSTPQRSSGYSSDIRPESNSKSSENLSRDVNLKDASHLSSRNKTMEVSSFSSEKENRSRMENKSQDESRHLGENRSGNLYTALNYAQTLKDYIFEDKLTIITQNLLNENCPREYVRYVNETIENLNHLISYKMTNLDETEVKRPRVEAKNDSRIAEDFQRNCSTPLFACNERMLNASTQVSANEVVQRISNVETEKRNEKHETYPKMISPQNLNPVTSGDISESETYAGIPKISMDRIFQSKNYHSRYKERKIERNLKSNALKLSANDCRDNLSYDSSVSLTEEEIQKNYEEKSNKARLNSNIPQFGTNTSKVFGGRTDLQLDPLRQNRIPLEVMRKTCFEENRKRIENSNTTANFNNANLTSLDRENRKTPNDKENLEANKQPGSLETFQMKEAQSSQHLKVDDQRGKLKATIVNSEVSALQRSKRPHKNQFLTFESDDSRPEQREKDEAFKNSTFLKGAETFQDPEKIASEDREISGNDYFGSENNPKLLEFWTPHVTFDGKNYHLIFEGILLNAVGRPMKKKFISNHVVRRVSSKVIETEDRQFYKLIGDLHNTKHVVPKELLPQCRNGCPAKIDHFCAMWLKLKGVFRKQRYRRASTKICYRTFTKCSK